MAKRKRQKDRQRNGQKKKNKRANNNQPIITQITKDRPTRTSLKAGVNADASEWLSFPAQRVTPVVLLSNETYII
jgi:hypothetical protein